MSVLKRCPVVMLPTEKATKIVLCHNDYLDYDNYEGELYVKSCIVFKNLYILSNEEIKEGDWWIRLSDNEIGKANQSFTHKSSSKLFKKIIATTDKSLRKATGEMWPEWDYLPEPSKAFIKVFIEAHNAGNTITEVDVEYESIQTTKKEDYQYSNSNSNLDYITKLKVNPKDHTITIKKTKNSWNREEVISLLKEYRNCVMSVEDKEIEYFNNWIKQNL